jgi:putative ABC transport system permease protein
MNFGQALIEAMESLSTNKLRSGLTILGIVIGVGAVIAMLAVGAGAQQSITGSISGIGTNLLFVFQGNFQETVRNVKPLTLDDANAMLDEFRAPSVVNVAPVIQSTLEVSFAAVRARIQVSGVTPDYFTVRNFSLTEGQFFTRDQQLQQGFGCLDWHGCSQEAVQPGAGNYR